MLVLAELCVRVVQPGVEPDTGLLLQNGWAQREPRTVAYTQGNVEQANYVKGDRAIRLTDFGRATSCTVIAPVQSAEQVEDLRAGLAFATGAVSGHQLTREDPAMEWLAIRAGARAREWLLTDGYLFIVDGQQIENGGSAFSIATLDATALDREMLRPGRAGIPGEFSYLPKSAPRVDAKGFVAMARACAAFDDGYEMRDSEKIAALRDELSAAGWEPVPGSQPGRYDMRAPSDEGMVSVLLRTERNERSDGSANWFERPDCVFAAQVSDRDTAMAFIAVAEAALAPSLTERTIAIREYDEGAGVSLQLDRKALNFALADTAEGMRISASLMFYPPVPMPLPPRQ